MNIAILMDEKVCTSNVSTVDLLDLEDPIDEIYEWLNNPLVWPHDELLRLIEETVQSFFGVDGCLEESDYEDFRFMLQILPDEVDGIVLLDLMMDMLDDGSEIDPEDYALFIDWLAREEASMLPGEAGRVFEYALATAPAETLEYYLILADEHDGHEAMVNLARTELYTYLGDEYHAVLVQLCDQETTMRVLQIISDQSAQKNSDIEEYEEMLGDAHDIVLALCEKAGIDPMTVCCCCGEDGDDYPEDATEDDDGAGTEAGEDADGDGDTDVSNPPMTTDEPAPAEPPADTPEGGPPEEGPGADPLPDA